MKKYKIIYILLALHLCSCEPEPYNAEIKYLISNASTHYVEITFFHTPVNNDTMFFIPPDSIIEYNSVFMGDSAYLNFDNAKQIIYRVNDGLSRNILIKENYIGGKKTNYLYEYVYEISDEDYENAIQINN